MSEYSEAMSGGYLGMDTDMDRMGQGGGYYTDSRQQNNGEWALLTDADVN